VDFTLYAKVFYERTLTKRQLVTGPLADRTMDYGAYLPAVLFIFYIVLIFWVMFGMIYFFAKGLVLKYLFLYVYIPKFEMGGKFFCSWVSSLRWSFDMASAGIFLS
jgi:hypothetical protein